MGTIVITLASVGAICIAGVGISSGLKWFHEYEIELSNKSKPTRERGVVNDRTEHLRKELRQRG